MSQYVEREQLTSHTVAMEMRRNELFAEGRENILSPYLHLRSVAGGIAVAWSRSL